MIQSSLSDPFRCWLLKAMSQPFHISRVESDGTPRLLEQADNLERAKTRVKRLAAFSPREYLISDQETGEKISIFGPLSPMSCRLSAAYLCSLHGKRSTAQNRPMVPLHWPTSGATIDILRVEVIAAP
ncbi:MAG: hypothetical protein DMG38_21110 [Acidobacteria bacterium]|nr:MAG: hypothetical protein DMG38_21110 [Acidobacteriota bacterium]